MRAYHKNPRHISSKQMKQLKGNLEELGDLGGIVHDLNSDEIIGGNQRSRALNVNTCEIELTHQGDEPDEQGTTAHGFIVWKGKRFSYRQVRWTKEQCAKANIVANKAGGFWDFDALANHFDMDDLRDWGFEDRDFGIEPEVVGAGMEFRGAVTEEGTKHIIYLTFTVQENVMRAMKVLTGNDSYTAGDDSVMRRVNGDKWLESLE